MRITCVTGIALILCLTACGGGGGSGGGSGGAVSPGATRSIDFPVGIVQIRKSSGQLVAGGAATLQISVADASPLGVTACIGSDWASASVFPAVAEGVGLWQAAVVCPSPLPSGSSVLVRLTMPDGEIYESATGDITIGGL